MRKWGRGNRYAHFEERKWGVGNGAPFLTNENGGGEIGTPILKNENARNWVEWDYLVIEKLKENSGFSLKPNVSPLIAEN